MSGVLLECTSKGVNIVSECKMRFIKAGSTEGPSCCLFHSLNTLNTQKYSYRYTLSFVKTSKFVQDLLSLAYSFAVQSLRSWNKPVSGLATTFR